MSKVKRKTKTKSKMILETTQKDSRIQDKYAKFQADLFFLQGWFARTSWKNKAKFITNAIRSLNDIATLRNIIEALSPITKDLSYSKSQTTKYSYDAVPNDDDRCLDETTLNTNIKIDLIWINSQYDESDKLNILLHLIKIGGTQLANLAISEATILSNILDFLIYLQTRFLKKPIIKLKHTMNLAKLISKELTKNPHILPLTDEYKVYLSFTQHKDNKNADKANKQSKMPFKNAKLLASSLKSVKNKQKAWENQLKKLIRMARTGLPERTRLLHAQTTDIDSLQSLPLWINKQIIYLLDNESRNNLSKVNHYWKYTVQEAEREKSVRKNLDDILQNMENKLLKIKLPGQRFEARMKKHKHPRRSEFKKRTVSDELGLLLQRTADFKESVYKYVKKIPDKYIPFNGIYNDMIIPTIYMYDRVIDCNRKWIAATENTFIVLYSIVTGGKSQFVLSGHSLVVTCLAFFPNSFRIASGSLDKTVRTWDLWSRELIEVFHGHRDVILSVSANEEYVVSCSRDNTVRIFKHLFGGICVKVVDDAYWTPTMATLSEDNIVYWSTREGDIKMFSITDQNIDKSIVLAHTSDAVSIDKFGPLIVTIGNDNYVRIWNQDFLYETCITAFYHEVGVNSLVITYLTLITACEDGALRFWHIDTGLLFRTIQINFSEIPMISLKCQEYYNHVKIICNNESNIYVLEFPTKRINRTIKHNLYEGIGLHPITSDKQISSKQRRLNKLNANKCTLPQLRMRENYKKYTYNTTAIIKNTFRDSCDIQSFPRFEGEPHSTEDNCML